MLKVLTVLVPSIRRSRWAYFAILAGVISVANTAYAQQRPQLLRGTLILVPPTATSSAQDHGPASPSQSTPLAKLPPKTLTPLGDTMAPLSFVQTDIPLPRSEIEPGEIVVWWRTEFEAAQALNLLGQEGMQPSARYLLPSLGGVLTLFRFVTDHAAAKALAQIRHRFPEAASDFNMRYYPNGKSRQFALEQLDSGPAKGRSTATGIKIGLLDSAVAAIPALSRSKLRRHSFLQPTDLPANDSHGTAVVALIAGIDVANRFASLAPGADIFAGEIMRKNSGREMTTTVLLVRGLDWLLAEQVQIINLSLGGPEDLVMRRVFDALLRKPVVIVAAAGNGGPDAAPSYPAAYAGVVAVSATDAAEAIYSNASRGAYITLVAPGVDVWVPDERNGHYVSGTSFAAALTTSAVGVLMAARPRMNVHDVRTLLCKSAKDLGEPGFDPIFGCGLLELRRAMALPLP